MNDVKISKTNSIRFVHPTIPAWNGETHYKDTIKLHQALKNIAVFVPENVRNDLRVFYRERDKAIHEWLE